VLTPVVGEEDGGAGTLASLVRLPSVAGAVVVEPTGLRIAQASAGAFRFRVRVPGRTAHGSVRRRGVSAIEKAWLVHQALLELERSRDERWPLCIGRIEGGAQPCDVPDLVVLDGRYGVAPHEDPAAARAALEHAVAAAAAVDSWLRTHPPRVTWVGAQWLPALTPLDDPLVGSFVTVGGEGPAVTMPYGSDAGLLRHVAGLPVVIVGPGEVADAHAADERVAVADLGRFAEVLLRGAARWWNDTRISERAMVASS
jgi:acetylornithine deacetylase